jgi:nicotinamidase-related amidase
MDLASLSDAEITEIEICGYCTDICVISNALILKSVFAPMNIDITVDAKACAGVTPEKHAAALEVMKSCQIIVKE